MFPPYNYDWTPFNAPIQPFPFRPLKFPPFPWDHTFHWWDPLNTILYNPYSVSRETTEGGTTHNGDDSDHDSAHHNSDHDSDYDSGHDADHDNEHDADHDVADHDVDHDAGQDADHKADHDADQVANHDAIRKADRKTDLKTHSPFDRKFKIMVGT